MPSTLMFPELSGAWEQGLQKLLSCSPPPPEPHCAQRGAKCGRHGGGVYIDLDMRCLSVMIVQDP